MNSSQRKQFNKKVNKLTTKFTDAIEYVIANYGKDDDVITVADLKSILEAIKDTK